VKGRLQVLEKDAQKKQEKQRESNAKVVKQQQKDKEKQFKIIQRREVIYAILTQHFNVVKEKLNCYQFHTPLSFSVS